MTAIQLVVILHLHTGMHDRKLSVIDILHHANAHMTKLHVNIHKEINIATVDLWCTADMTNLVSRADAEARVLGRL